MIPDFERFPQNLNIIWEVPLEQHEVRGLIIERYGSSIQISSNADNQLF